MLTLFTTLLIILSIAPDAQGNSFQEGDSVPARTWDFEPFRGPRPDFGYIGVQNHGEEDVVFLRKLL